ncbi:MAG: hypothetical protein RLZ77_1137, partial [Bacteroidota bacterium]
MYCILRINRINSQTYIRFNLKIVKYIREIQKPTLKNSRSICISKIVYNI